jgi:hypothetical protein
VTERLLRSRLHGTGIVMADANEYRQYADECLESARTATTEDVRNQFLDLAKMWMTAAQQLDDGISIPPSPERRGDTPAH